jgi:hypothetical protein
VESHTEVAHNEGTQFLSDVERAPVHHPSTFWGEFLLARRQLDWSRQNHLVARPFGGRFEPQNTGKDDEGAFNDFSGGNALALRFSAFIGMFSMARSSAMKKAANLQRSSVCAKRVMCLKLKFASG